MTGRVNLVTSTEQEFGTDSNPVVVKSPTGSSIATFGARGTNYIIAKHRR